MTQVPLVFFEEDAWKKAGALCKMMGVTKALVVFGSVTRKSGLADNVIAALKGAGVEAAEFTNVRPDPSYHDINEGGKLARSLGVNAVIGVGGGSAMDTAKGIYIMLGNPQTENIMDHCLGGRGKNLPMKRPNALLMMIPTTSGTGSEVSTGCVITDDEINYKALLGGLQILPNIALMDPKLDVTMPQSLTAATAFDALAHGLESYVIGGLANAVKPTMQFNPWTDMLALEAVRKIFRCLPAVLEHPEDVDARAEIKFAAMADGIAMCAGGLTLGHGIAQTLGALWHIPHGVGCAWGLVPSVRQGVKVPHNTPERYRALAEAMGISVPEDANMEALSEAICDGIEKLMDTARIPTIKSLGHTPEEIDGVVTTGMKDPCCFCSVTADELRGHLEYEKPQARTLPATIS